MRQQIAGQLLGRESVEGKVAVECVDHVIAVHPDVAVVVHRVAVGVGVADKVEPEDRHPLAKMRRGEEAIHGLFISVGGPIADEGGDLVGRRRQARQREVQPAQQCGRARIAGRSEPVRLVLGGEKSIDRVAPPSAAVDGRSRRPHGGNERPVQFVLRPLVDPAAEHIDLGGAEPDAVRMLRRHHLARVVAADAGQEQARPGITGDDRGANGVSGAGPDAGSPAGGCDPGRGRRSNGRRGLV